MFKKFPLLGYIHSFFLPLTFFSKPALLIKMYFFLSIINFPNIKNVGINKKIKHLKKKINGIKQLIIHLKIPYLLNRNLLVKLQ